jgi:type II secretory pathway pseudopilin PulG
MLFKRNKGMTLTETLVALSIFIIIMVVVGTFQVNVFSYQKSVSGSFQTAQDAQVLLKVIMKEIRSITPSANGAYPIESVSTSSIVFYSDSNGDGIVEKYTYTLIGSSLFKAVIIPTGTPAVYNIASQSTTTLVTNIRNGSSLPMFQYYDENFDGSTSELTYPISIPLIRTIKVTLNLDVDPNRSPLPLSYSSIIQLRNLKTNL